MYTRCRAHMPKYVPQKHSTPWSPLSRYVILPSTLPAAPRATRKPQEVRVRAGEGRWKGRGEGWRKGVEAAECGGGLRVRGSLESAALSGNGLMEARTKSHCASARMRRECTGVCVCVCVCGGIVQTQCQTQYSSRDVLVYQ